MTKEKGNDMGTATPVVDRIRALQESMEQAAKIVNDWSPAKRESADVTIQTRGLASYYESQLPAERSFAISQCENLDIVASGEPEIQPQDPETVKPER